MRCVNPKKPTFWVNKNINEIVLPRRRRGRTTVLSGAEWVAQPIAGQPFLLPFFPFCISAVKLELPPDKDLFKLVTSSLVQANRIKLEILCRRPAKRVHMTDPMHQSPTPAGAHARMAVPTQRGYAA